MKMSYKHIAVAAASLSMALAATAAQATKIDFEDIVTLTDGQAITYGAPGTTELGATAQSSQGFNFNWVEFGIPNVLVFIHGHLANHALIDGGGDLAPLNTDPLSPHYLVTDDTVNPTANALTISDATNAFFTLQAFSAAKAFSLAQAATSVTVTGNINAIDGGGTLTSTFDLLGAINPGAPNDALLDPITLGPEWDGIRLDSVIFAGVGTGDNYFAIDDIIVNEPVVVDPDPTVGVPEPSSLALFGFGAVAFGWVARRRRAA